MDIENILREKDWESLIRKVLPVTIAVSFSFDKSMEIAGDLLNDSGNAEGDPAMFMRDYSVNLMIILREKFPQQWKVDWKNEAFLGICCNLVYREEEAFKHLKNALECFDNPPQSLILTYIRTGGAPNYYLSAEEIVELAHKAVKSGITLEMAQQMADLATTQEDWNSWTKKAKEAEANNIHTAVIVPDVLKDNVRTLKDYPYEK